MARDDFLQSIKETLGRRVSLCCSNPDCGKPTGGPHSDPAKSMNIGVAAHITAASLGGPRFDASLSSEERSSIENAIWLCQSCAKLIDSDPIRYSAQQLRLWKRRAEGAALLELENRAIQVQGSAAGFPHSPIPSLSGKSYDEARALLISSGWQPSLNHWTHGNSFEFQFGNGKYFWKKGYWEIRGASGTGLAHCAFDFDDVYLNRLVVVTAGEVHEPSNSAPIVCQWFLERDTESV